MMILHYFHVCVAPFRRLKQALASQDPQEGNANLIPGVIVVAIGAGGRYLQACRSSAPVVGSMRTDSEIVFNRFPQQYFPVSDILHD